MGHIKRVLYDLVEFVVSSLSEGYELEEIDELVENNFPDQYEFYLKNKEFIMEEVDTRIDDDNFNRVEEPDGQEGVYIGHGQYRPYTKDEQPSFAIKDEDEVYEARIVNTGWHFSQMSKGKKVKYKGKIVTLTSVGADSAFAKDADGKQVKIKSIKEISPINERLVSGDDKERSIDLRGPEGNAFAILGTAKNFTRQLKEMYPEKYNWEKIQSEMTSGSYTNLVHTFEKYFGDYITIYGADVLKESLRYNENPIDDFKLYFREHYPYIYCDLSNREISKFLTSNHIMALPIEQQANLFSDYLMSQGLCDVDESLNDNYMSVGHRVKFTYQTDELLGYYGTIISCDGDFAKIKTDEGDIVKRNVSSLLDLSKNECCGGGIKRPKPIRRPTTTNLPPKPRLHESTSLNNPISIAVYPTKKLKLEDAKYIDCNDIVEAGKTISRVDSYGNEYQVTRVFYGDGDQGFVSSEELADKTGCPIARPDFSVDENYITPSIF